MKNKGRGERPTAKGSPAVWGQPDQGDVRTFDLRNSDVSIPDKPTVLRWLLELCGYFHNTHDHHLRRF